MGYCKDSEGYLDTLGFICRLNIWDTGIWEREVRKLQDITEALFDHSNALRKLVKEILIQEFPADDPNALLRKHIVQAQDLRWDRNEELKQIPKSYDFILMMDYTAVTKYEEQRLTLKYGEDIVKIEKKYHLLVENLFEVEKGHGYSSRIKSLKFDLFKEMNKP